MKTNHITKEFLQDVLTKNFPHITFNFEALYTLYSQVELWGEKLSITKSKGSTLLYKHLIDSILPIDHFLKLKPKSVLDIGSGAGFPGLVLATIMSDTQFILSDLREKREGFLIATSALMGLKNVKVVQDAFSLDYKTDVATFRALSNLDDKFVKKIFTKTNLIYAYKGTYANTKQEADSLKNYSSHLYKLDVIESNETNIETKEERTLLILSNNAPSQC